ncbi:hypothetical protein RB594_003752 [Gaeumannomyces avenae]
MPKMQRVLIRAGILATVSSPAVLATAVPYDKADTNQFQQVCADFAKTINIANSTVTSAEFVPAGTTINFPNADRTCTRPSQLVTVPLCRVQANISTSADSGLHWEAWLPQDWTGRFLSTGNGGLGGCLQYDDVEWAASLGFAAVGTNNGHDGMSGAVFLNRPDVVEDFAYRAMVTGVRAGKAVTRDFYGRPHTKSYYLGCSTGGRQGMKMVQDFPDLFDGVSAGAPAFNFNNLNTWSGHFLYLTGTNTSDTFVSRDLWAVVHQDILEKCDALDGNVDGVLEAPDLCRYAADDLLCGGARGATAPHCLTASQVGTVNAVFSEMRSVDGASLYPRMQPGSEAGAFDVYYTGLPSPYLDWLRYVVMADPSFDVYAFPPELWTKPDQLNPFDIRSFKGDISAFRDRGGKLLHYHGLMDNIISSDISPRYYDEVSRALGGASPDELDGFYRLFRISGMGHCRGGPGAHFIGNNRAQLSADPGAAHDSVLMKLVRWVEDGEAPDVIRGAGTAGGGAGPTTFARDHCRWPLMNRFQGGDASSPDSWKCVSYNATT